MNNYDSIMKNLLANAIKHEARLSDRQVATLRWQQLSDHKLTTNLGREVRLSDATWTALMSMRVGGGYVFSTTPLPPSGLPSSTLLERAGKGLVRWKNKPRKHLRIEFR